MYFLGYAVNFVYCLVGLKYLLFVQLFLVNNFYLAIFYYVGHNVIRDSRLRVGLYAFCIAIGAVYIAILVLRSLDEYENTPCSRISNAMQKNGT